MNTQQRSYLTSANAQIQYQAFLYAVNDILNKTEDIELFQTLLTIEPEICLQAVTDILNKFHYAPNKVKRYLKLTEQIPPLNIMYNQLLKIYISCPKEEIKQKCRPLIEHYPINESCRCLMLLEEAARCPEFESFILQLAETKRLNFNDLAGRNFTPQLSAAFLKTVVLQFDAANCRSFIAGLADSTDIPTQNIAALQELIEQILPKLMEYYADSLPHITKILKNKENPFDKAWRCHLALEILKYPSAVTVEILEYLNNEYECDWQSFKEIFEYNRQTYGITEKVLYWHERIAAMLCGCLNSPDWEWPNFNLLYTKEGKEIINLLIEDIKTGIPNLSSHTRGKIGIWLLNLGTEEYKTDWKTPLLQIAETPCSATECQNKEILSLLKPEKVSQIGTKVMEKFLNSLLAKDYFYAHKNFSNRLLKGIRRCNLILPEIEKKCLEQDDKTIKEILASLAI